jgi:hypothetical protein
LTYTPVRSTIGSGGKTLPESNRRRIEMSKRNIAPALLLAVVALGALGAQGASAAVVGTTAFTCKMVTPAPGTAGFSKEHCKPEDAVSTEATYEHVAIPENTKTEVTVSNETTGGETEVAKLKETVGGVGLELQATTTHAEGWMENRINPETHEHYIFGEGATTYTGVTVTKPAGKGCKVWTDNGGAKGEEGAVHTNTLKGTSAGQGMRGMLEPAGGGVVATFILECGVTKVPGIEGTWEITGKVTCPGSGTTVHCLHSEITEEETLIGKGNKLGVEVSTTPKGRTTSTQAYTPLAVTTIET